jgi:phenol hydroxylase P2 protein
MTDSFSLARMELMAGEEAEAIVEAALEATPGLVVHRLPGIVQLEAPGRLEFACAVVSELLGRPWDTRELQVIMAAYAGNIDQMDEEGVVLSWHESTPGAAALSTATNGRSAI